MAYGTVKVDNITFTNGGIDQTVTVSSIVQSISGNITSTGTVQAATIIGTSTVSGATVTGTAGVFTTVTGSSAGFTTVTGTTVTGTTANFNVGIFTSVTGGTAGFTTVTGTTVTGTTANFITLSGTTITGSVGNFGSGSEAAPSVSVGTTDNGIYSPGTDQVAISTNGSGRITVDASGNVNVDSGTVYVDAANNRLGVGTTSASERLTVSGNIGVPESAKLICTDATQSYFQLSSGTSEIGYQEVLAFRAFKSGSPTEVGRWDASGRLLVGTTSAVAAGAKLQTVDGITFPAMQVASADPNTLDDYEEGTSSTSLYGTTTNPSGLSYNPTSYYTKIGRFVYFNWGGNGASWSSAGTGDFYIEAPFACANINDPTFQPMHGISIVHHNGFFNVTNVIAKIEQNSNRVYFYQAGSITPLTWSNLAQSKFVSMQLTYNAAT